MISERFRSIGKRDPAVAIAWYCGSAFYAIRRGGVTVKVIV